MVALSRVIEKDMSFWSGFLMGLDPIQIRWIGYEVWGKENSPRHSHQGPFSQHVSYILILSGNYPVFIFSYHNSALLLIMVNAVYIFNGYMLSQLECRILSGRGQSIFIFPQIPHTVSGCSVERALDLVFFFLAMPCRDVGCHVGSYFLS